MENIITLNPVNKNVIEPTSHSTLTSPNITNILPSNPKEWILLISSIMLTILFLVASYFGSKETWYVNLPDKQDENLIPIAVLWVIAVILSYVPFYLLRNFPENIYGQSRLFPFFLIVSILNLLWVVVFFKSANFLLTLFILAVLFTFQFFILIFVLDIYPIAALFLIPVQLLYGYLFYSIMHLASVNHIPL